MSLAAVARRFFFLLLPIALVLTSYLYLYPAFHGCSFPAKDGSRVTALQQTVRRHAKNEQIVLQDRDIPIFRLLVLADPQLEGDSSLPDPQDGLLSSLARRLRTISDSKVDSVAWKDLVLSALRDICYKDIPRSLRAVRKQVDLFGNDFYLAHVFRTLRWWTKPTHVTVLGDLIGSQWVDDEEFQWRSWRYWNRVFRGGQKIDASVQQNGSYALHEPGWAHRIINIVGNHDIGYAGDISEERLERFSKVFGPINWDARFAYPIANQTTSHPPPSLHLVVLNSMSLDGPAMSHDITSATYDYLNSVMSRSHPVEDRTSFTLLLTHLPLHKPAGVCVDPPFFNYWDHDDPHERFRQDALREQNHMSEHVSIQGVLQGIFGMTPDRTAAARGKGRQGLVLTGHDHEGCDTWHYLPSRLEGQTPPEENEWQSTKFDSAKFSASYTGVREVTLRSMMGDYGGNAGLLSAWFDFDAGEWRYEIEMCRLGVQHIWWVVHVLDIITSVTGLVWSLSACRGKQQSRSGVSKSIASSGANGKTKERIRTASSTKHTLS